MKKLTNKDKNKLTVAPVVVMSGLAISMLVSATFKENKEMKDQLNSQEQPQEVQAEAKTENVNEVEKDQSEVEEDEPDSTEGEDESDSIEGVDEEPAPVEEDVSNMTPEQQIRHYAKEANFQWPDYLVRLAKCESGLNPNAINHNTNSTIDKGIFQWNQYYHPHMTDECVYDVECATKATMEKINAGGQGIWVCDKKIRGI